MSFCTGQRQMKEICNSLGSVGDLVWQQRTNKIVLKRKDSFIDTEKDKLLWTENQIMQDTCLRFPHYRGTDSFCKNWLHYPSNIAEDNALKLAL